MMKAYKKQIDTVDLIFSLKTYFQHSNDIKCHFSLILKSVKILLFCLQFDCVLSIFFCFRFTIQSNLVSA